RYTVTRSAQTSTLSLHDALPIFGPGRGSSGPSGLPSTTEKPVPEVPMKVRFSTHCMRAFMQVLLMSREPDGDSGGRRHELGAIRSEEHTSELQSRENLVCRLLLE